MTLSIPLRLGRRSAVQAALAAGVALPLGHAEAADEAPPDLGVACEPPLLSPMRAVGGLFRARTGTPVVTLAAPGPLIVAQIKREARADVLILPSGVMDQALQMGLIQPATRRKLGRNPLVFAALRRFDQIPSDPAAMTRLLGDQKLAVTDATAAATFDGYAALDWLGLREPLAARLIGAANADDVAFLLSSGAARFGLLPRSVVAAAPDLVVVLAADPGRLPPEQIEAALNKAAHSPRAGAFLDLLTTQQAALQLRAAGLETSI